jgi:hypothetical protein
MPLQRVVKRGDSLWGLAGRHLGNFERWPELVEYHNDEVRRSGGNRGRVFHIKDPNVIFVGQILYLPIRDRHMMRNAKATGATAQAGNMAVPINLKVEYAIDHNRQPLVYMQETNEHIIGVELRGKITIEITSADRFRNNLDLLMSKDVTQCRLRLREVYNPVIKMLIAKPEMAYKMGVVTIDSLISSGAANGPYAVKVAQDKPDHLSGISKPQPTTGNLHINGREYRYSAQIELKVDVKASSEKIADSHGVHHQRGFFSTIGDGLQAAGENLHDTFSNKKFQKEVGGAFVKAAKLAVIVHTGVTIKAAALHAVAATPIAMLPITINNTAMAFIDGYPPMPPSTAQGTGVIIGSMALEWALSPAPWEH